MIVEWFTSYAIKITLLAILLYLIRRIFLLGTFTKLKTDLTSKIIIVTGASAGIGKSTAIQLLQDGAEVVFACRDKHKTMKVFEEILNMDQNLLKRAHFLELNLISFNSVLNFVKNFKAKFPKLDILINNAAEYPIDFYLTEDHIEYTFQSNHLSQIVLTTHLLDHFDKKEGRIINVSSFAHIQCDWTIEKLAELKEDKLFQSIEKEYYTNMWRKHYHYANAKTGGIYFTNYLGEYLEQYYPHIKVACLSPGLVYTEFARFFSQHRILGKLYSFLFPIYKYIAKTSLGGAQTSLHLCYLDLKDFVNGAYYDNCKLANTSSLAKDKKIRDSVIELSVNLIKNHKDLSQIGEKLKIKKYIYH